MSAPAGQSVTPRRRALRIIRRGLTGWVLVLTALLLVRWVFRDWFLLTEPLFMLPAGLLILPAVAVVPFTGGPLKARALAAVSLLLAILLTIQMEQPRLLTGGAGSDPLPDAVALTAWNVMSYNRGQDAVIEGFQTPDADIVALLEGTWRSRPPDFIEAALPEHQWTSTRQMAIGATLPLRNGRELRTDSRLRVFRAEADIPGGTVALLLVDVPSPPRTDTAEIYEELKTILESEALPFILMGDFNTPRGSWRLRRATRPLQDFYLEAPEATRWLASWPAEFPIYQLDHAFASDEITPLRARLLGPEGSDHFRQHLEFRLGD